MASSHMAWAVQPESSKKKAGLILMDLQYFVHPSPHPSLSPSLIATRHAHVVSDTMDLQWKKFHLEGPLFAIIISV